MDTPEPVTAEAGEPVAPKTMTGVVAIRTYFFEGMSATDVMAEYKKLSPADRIELAEGAAKELGVTLA